VLRLIAEHTRSNVRERAACIFRQGAGAVEPTQHAEIVRQELCAERFPRVLGTPEDAGRHVPVANSVPPHGRGSNCEPPDALREPPTYPEPLLLLLIIVRLCRGENVTSTSGQG
jgi:hypothetical protein